MLKKSLAFLLTFILMASLFTGCSKKASTDTNATGTPTATEAPKQITIKFMTFSAAPDHIKDLEQMISKFQDQNPNIKVEYETVKYDDYFTKLQSLVAGNTAPDVFELNYENFVAYASNGSILDLTDTISKDKTYDAAAYDQTANEAFKYNGKQYGLVESFSDVVLFYNKDLFDKAKVEYPKESWTWKDELAAAQKLTDSKKGIWGTYSPIQFWEFYKTIAQNGGSIFSKDMSQVTINSKENVETLQWMIDKVNKYHVTPSDAQMGGQKNEDLFKAGKIGMLRSGIWMFSYFKDAPFKWDIALEPGNTQKAHHYFANCLALSSKTQNAEAALKFAHFVTANKEAVKIRVDSSWELPAVSDKTVLDTYLKQTPPESRQVVFDALKTLVVPPVIEKENELTDIVGKQLDKARLGQETPQKALDEAKSLIEPLIKK